MATHHNPLRGDPVVLLLLASLIVCAQTALAQDAPQFGRELTLPGLSETACREVYELAVREALLKFGYSKVAREEPEKVGGLTEHAYLVRQEGAGERVLIVGLRSFATQDTRIYLWGTVPGGDALQPNPDLAAVAAVVESAKARPADGGRTFAVRELEHETYELGYIGVEKCAEVLKMLGYNTAPPDGPVSIEQLPVVFALPDEPPNTVVGVSDFQGKTEPEPANFRLTEETGGAPRQRLMIAYHPSQTLELAKLKDDIQNVVDVPDRMVVIEGMIIELSEDDLKELGLQWEYFGEDWLKVTFLNAEDNTPFVISYNPEFAPPAALADRVRSTLTAIIQEGRAEVLSNPSVLVLNNRNARIKVVRDTPIVKSKVTFDVTSVDVEFKPVGVVLNIKPRINHDNSAVTMQIVAEVSEIPPGVAIEVGGTVVAPAIDRRIVETVARVHNNTPFIIGGLIRDKESEVVNRIPIISRIPLIGWLFKRRTTINEKREVIIVLTPRVLQPEESHRAVLPKDSERFDFLNNRLFRNSYRIKREDVLDLEFLRRDETLLAAFEDARRLVARHPQYADRPPFNEFANRVIPGEEAITIRMVYEIIKETLKLDRQIDAEQDMIVFEKDDSKPAGFRVTFLAHPKRGVLNRVTSEGTLDAYFEQEYPKKILMLRFPQDPEGGLQAALASPVAQFEWLTVADEAEEDAIEERLLEINAVGSDYQYHEFAVALRDGGDMDRLKRAIVVREVAQVNEFGGVLSLRNFTVGRRILIPEMRPGRIYLVDHRIAEIFYKSDYYYAALEDKLEMGYALLQNALRQEGL